ncbi:MAG: hypothetical protein RI926_1421 [Actinomycetota bacterium]|jgi:3-phenylpropionate/trans-cinnamate dioxygenase ferredoxin reductase subunit
MKEKILIIGAGQAGMQIASSLRDEGYAGDVTIVGEESYAPYQRPPLSKAYLAGDMDEESLEFRNEHFYVENNIGVVTGEKIVHVEFGPTGGVAKGSSGQTYEFDKLALTPGADPRKLKVDGADLDGVLYMRHLDDAKELKKRWDSITNVVVLGGGFIGLEVAAVAQKAGKNITVLQSGSRLMGRAVSSIVSDFYKAAHEKRGTTVHLNAQVSHLVGENGKVTGVQLADGSVVPADIVMAGIGVTARGELADQLALEMEDGVIVVNEFAETSNPNVVAAGDAVILPHPLGHEGNVRLESVQNAVDQAKVAAKTLMGIREPYRAVPWFWSDQADLKLQIAGLSSGYDQTVIRGDMSADKFSVLYYKNGSLLAIDAVNDVSDYMAVRRALNAGANIPADAAADSSIPLKTLITGGEA